jgi:uncharacterized protein (TIGR02145 family)
MKAIINSSRRTLWFKTSIAFLTCLLFLVFPSCQKDELNQDPLLNLDNMSPFASANNSKLTGKIKDVEGNWYKTVKIGDQWWMAENLKTTKYNNRAPIDYPGDNNTMWEKNITGAYAWYNNDIDKYKNTYGALYNFYAVITGNLCPSGWHVPTNAEWTTLTYYLGGDGAAGGQLKETGFAHWWEPNEGAINETGFTGLPGGSRNYDGSYAGLGDYGIYWTSTEYSHPDYTSGFGWGFWLISSSTGVNRSGTWNATGCYVRCLKGK